MTPAPFWFVQFFKVVGFVLHMIPMGIWFAGLPVVIGCALWNCRHSRRYARRMFGQFPIFMALGINFGIVPLLFLQTTYYKSFYTATILMAWHWIAVIPILIVGYYSLYLAAFAAQGKKYDSKTEGAAKRNFWAIGFHHQHCQTSRCRSGAAKRNFRAIGFGILASFCLICIGILMTNGMTLMVRSDLWSGIMERTNYFGATTGLANNMSDPAVWIRLATMFGLGLITVGIWSVVDSHLLLPRNEDISNRQTYQHWTVSLAAVLTVLGAVILTGTEWCVKTGNSGDALKTAYPYFGFIVLLAYTVLVSLILAKAVSRKLVTVSVLLHILTLAGFGIIRQIGQNAGVAQYVDVSQLETAIQWSPLIAFLIVFVLGLGIIGWMLRQAAVGSVGSEKDS